MSKKFNFMDSIYGVLDSSENDYTDDILYVDDQDDYLYGIEDEMSWANDVTIIGDFEEDDVIDLGEGYIPLPKGQVEEQPVIVIDEDYVLEEYETDLIDLIPTYYREDANLKSNKMSYSEPVVDLNKAESIVSFQEDKKPEEELEPIGLSSEDDKIAKSIAKEFLENSGAEPLLGDEFKDEADDTSWVDGPDLFGNDIDVIIAEDPNSEFIEDDFVDGSFEDWLAQNSTNESY